MMSTSSWESWYFTYEASYTADMIFGNAVLMCAKGEELVGFRKEHAERIINEWLL